MTLIDISKEEAMGIALFVWLLWLLGLVNSMWFGFSPWWALLTPLILPLVVSIIWGLIAMAVMTWAMFHSGVRGTWIFIKLIPSIPAGLKMAFADTEEEGES